MTKEVDVLLKQITLRNITDKRFPKPKTKKQLLSLSKLIAKEENVNVASILRELLTMQKKTASQRIKVKSVSLKNLEKLNKQTEQKVLYEYYRKQHNVYLSDLLVLAKQFLRATRDNEYMQYVYPMLAPFPKCPNVREAYAMIDETKRGDRTDAKIVTARLLGWQGRKSQAHNPLIMQHVHNNEMIKYMYYLIENIHKFKRKIYKMSGVTTTI